MEKLEKELPKEAEVEKKTETKNGNEIPTKKEQVSKEEKTEKKPTQTPTNKGNKLDPEKVEDFFNKKNAEKKKENNTENSKPTDNNLQLKQYKKNPKLKKRIIIILIILIAILISLLSTIFAINTSLNDKIISGISINGIDVSNLTKSEAYSKLTSELQNSFDKNLTLTRGDYNSTLNANSIEAKYNIQESIEQAYNVGRTGNNIFSNNYTVIKTIACKTNITPAITFNEALLDEKFDTIDSELPDRVVNSNYKIEEGNLIITSGTDGYKIKRNDLKNNIYSALSNNNLSVEILVEKYHTDDVDIDAIHTEIYKEPVNASFKASPYELHKEENGLDFAINLEEARAMVSDRQDTYTIPLKVLKPEITVRDLPSEAFPDELSSYSTTYAQSNYNRSTNISIATRTVNGIVLMPGETFSYNDTLGQRTAAKGYKEAGAYVNGQVSSEVGGGICQVSSTLYNAALLCNLEIVTRTNHSFEPSYVPAGQDATVSWRSPDFQFKNNREYPIKLVASAGSGRVTFTIYGVKSDNDYEVKIQSSKTGSIPFSTQYVNDDSLPVGTTKVTQSGSNGCRSVTYKILYKNGEEVSRTLINSDTYKPHNQVVAKGTKPVPEPSREPDNTNENTTTDDDSVTITNVDN